MAYLMSSRLEDNGQNSLWSEIADRITSQIPPGIEAHDWKIIFDSVAHDLTMPAV